MISMYVGVEGNCTSIFVDNHFYVTEDMLYIEKGRERLSL
jgi:hypothetical protein